MVESIIDCDLWVLSCLSSQLLSLWQFHRPRKRCQVLAHKPARPVQHLKNTFHLLDKTQTHFFHALLLLFLLPWFLSSSFFVRRHSHHSPANEWLAWLVHLRIETRCVLLPCAASDRFARMRDRRHLARARTDGRTEPSVTIKQDTLMHIWYLVNRRQRLMQTLRDFSLWDLLADVWGVPGRLI